MFGNVSFSSFSQFEFSLPLESGLGLFSSPNLSYTLQDGESGWSSLHRALHFGHLAVASLLLQSGASITVEDSKSRTPVDLLSGPVVQTVRDGDNSGIYWFEM